MKHNLPFITLALVVTIRVLVYLNSDLKSVVDQDSLLPQPLNISLTHTRSFLSAEIAAVLPSPHSELLLGMAIGVDNFSKLPVFKDKLRACGVIHVVVVSGFNINLVSSLLLKFLGSKYLTRNVCVVIIFTLFYSLLSGFEPPVVRAWIMGTTTSIFTFYGRRLAALRVLLFSAFVMLLISPSNISSLSFQLSVLATMGLILFSSSFAKLLDHARMLPHVLREDISSTFAAQMLVLPLISYYFGEVSLLGFVLNPLILWTVPVSTFLGMLLCVLSYFSHWLAQLCGFLVFPFLDLFVICVNLMSRLSFINVPVKLSLASLLAYYFFLGLILVVVRMRFGTLKESE